MTRRCTPRSIHCETEERAPKNGDEWGRIPGCRGNSAQSGPGEARCEKICENGDDGSLTRRTSSSPTPWHSAKNKPREAAGKGRAASAATQLCIGVTGKIGLVGYLWAFIWSLLGPGGREWQGEVGMVKSGARGGGWMGQAGGDRGPYSQLPSQRLHRKGHPGRERSPFSVPPAPSTERRIASPNLPS